MIVTSPGYVAGVDWGTTHRRAYLLDGGGALLATRSDSEGVLAARDRFGAALEQLLAPWVGAYGPMPVLMSGMVGSAQGWQQTPYLDSATGLREIGRHLCRVDSAQCGQERWIVPGYLWRSADGQPDVMRGEETQLLGALQLGHGDGWYVLPGTHSKWVLLESGKIKDLRTFMTGELFSMVKQQGTLASLMGSDEQDMLAFERGVNVREEALSHALFTCRARVVCGDWPASMASDYVSGVLIGAEWHEMLRASTSGTLLVNLIGQDALSARYAQAARLLGCAVNIINPEQAFVAAMAHLQARKV